MPLTSAPHSANASPHRVLIVWGRRYMSYIPLLGSGGWHGGSRAALLVGSLAASHGQDIVVSQASLCHSAPDFAIDWSAKRQWAAHDFFGTLIFIGA